MNIRGTDIHRGEGRFAQGHMLGKGRADDLTAELMEITWTVILLKVANMQKGNWKDLP